MFNVLSPDFSTVAGEKLKTGAFLRTTAEVGGVRDVHLV